jgi:hypothetical protein
MATIEQRTGRDGQQVYRVKVRRKGQRPQTATFAKLSDAKRWAQITEGAVVEGRRFPSTAAKRHTASDLIDRYIADVLPSKRPSTAYNQRYQLRWWKAQLGHYVLADVTPALLVECRDKLARNKARRQSGATVNRWLAVLRHCFTMAVREWQWCDDNPVRKITKPREPRGRTHMPYREDSQHAQQSMPSYGITWREIANRMHDTGTRVESKPEVDGRRHIRQLSRLFGENPGENRGRRSFWKDAADVADVAIDNLLLEIPPEPQSQRKPSRDAEKAESFWATGGLERQELTDRLYMVVSYKV